MTVVVVVVVVVVMLLLLSLPRLKWLLLLTWFMIDFFLRFESWSLKSYQNRLTFTFAHTVVEQNWLVSFEELFQCLTSNTVFLLWNAAILAKIPSFFSETLKE